MSWLKEQALPFERNKLHGRVSDLVLVGLQARRNTVKLQGTAERACVPDRNGRV